MVTTEDQVHPFEAISVVNQWIVGKDVSDGVAGANSSHYYWEVVALVHKNQADYR
jgi:hypothetical protein